MSRTISAIVLDVDGTLVDSNQQHARAWCEALEANGFRASYAVVRKLIGMGGDKLFPRMTGFAEDTPIGKKASKLRGDIFRKKYLPKIKALRGSREMVQRMSRSGVEIAIATSADEKDLRALLEIADVADLIEKKASSADAKRSKPDPGIVTAALRKLDVPKKKVLMVGDTPYDIEAAALAGIRTIAFRSGGGWTDDELVGALEICDGPWELAERWSVLSAP